MFRPFRSVPCAVLTCRAAQGDVKYPSLMALEGEDNEVLLGSTFAVAFQYRGPSVAAEKHAPFWYVNVTVTG